MVCSSVVFDGIFELMKDRDHVELPADFQEKAREVMKLHKATPVAADVRGLSHELRYNLVLIYRRGIQYRARWILEYLLREQQSRVRLLLA
jgi:hypothetical protein